jgi:hypothetical protein
MGPADEPDARLRATPVRFRALEDARVVARIHAAEERVRNGPTGKPEDDLVSVDELELVIADLRAERGRGLVEDQE